MESSQARNLFCPDAFQQINQVLVPSFRPASAVSGASSVQSAEIVHRSPCRIDSGYPDKIQSATVCGSSECNYQDIGLELELEEIFVGNIRQSTCQNEEERDVIPLEDSSTLSGLFDDENAVASGVDLPPSEIVSPPQPLVKATKHRPGVTVSPVPSNYLRSSTDSLPRSRFRLDRSPLSCSPHPDQHRFKPFHEQKWNLRLGELKQYRREHGSCLVPHTYPTNPQLARWTKRQRRQYKLYKSGRASTMTLERLQLLEEIGFVWDSHEACWQEKMQELVMYKSKFGNCLVPSNYKKNPQLATWVKCQRRQYKLYWLGRASAMTPKRIVQLEGLGFEWEIRSNASNMDGSDYLMLTQAISNM